MKSLDTYYDSAIALIKNVNETQKANVESVAEMFADCINHNGVVQLVGIGHGRTFGMELGYRAGGLVPFHEFMSRDLVLRGAISEEEAKDEVFAQKPENAQIWKSTYALDPNDMFTFSTFTATEPLLVEMAKQAKEEGRKVLLVTSRAAAEKAKAEGNPSVLDYADQVLDTLAGTEDRIVDINGFKAGQLNTIAANTMAQMLTADTYACLTAQGKEAPVLLSDNVTGADEHNRRMVRPYDGRWNS